MKNKKIYDENKKRSKDEIQKRYDENKMKNKKRYMKNKKILIFLAVAK